MNHRHFRVFSKQSSRANASTRASSVAPILLFKGITNSIPCRSISYKLFPSRKARSCTRERITLVSLTFSLACSNAARICKLSGFSIVSILIAKESPSEVHRSPRSSIHRAEPGPLELPGFSVSRALTLRFRTTEPHPSN